MGLRVRRLMGFVYIIQLVTCEAYTVGGNVSRARHLDVQYSMLSAS